MSTRKGAPAAVAKQDPRFAAVGTDPRFQRFPKKQKRVEIDERFAGMFTDPSFQQPARVDKRGRKVQAGKGQNDIKAFYRLKDEADDVPGREQQAQRPSAGKADAELDVPPERIKRRKTADSRHVVARTKHVDEENAQGEQRQAHRKAGSRIPYVADDSDEEAAKAAARYARMRGLVDAESSSEEDDDADALADDTVAGAELASAWGVGAFAANPDEDVPLVNEDTSRLALVDLDWDKLRAMDILAALRSFLPAGGLIKRVTVYPSDYGLRRMQQEAAEGPTGIYRSSISNGSAAQLGASELDDEEEMEERGAEDAAAEAADADDGSDSEAESGNDNDDADEVDREALRLYERSKLRWYYAVAECDSARTAAHLYAECDGMEYGLSACKFDLRFVPDAQSFQGREERDSATAVPDDYEPPNFQTVALQHTNVQLTWDADDDGRKRALSAKRATPTEIREDDFKAYLASSSGERSDDAHEDAAAKQQRLRALLLSGDGGGNGDRTLGRSGGKGWAAAADDGGDSEHDHDDDREDDARPRRDVDMEVVFQPGLQGLGERLLAGKRGKASRSSETVWDAYMRKRKEKREAAKAIGRRDASDSDDVSDPEASPRGAGAEQDGHDPFFQHDDNVFDDPWFAADDGDASKADDRAAGAAANGHQAAERAKSEKWQAARAAVKAAAAEEDRRRADLEMLMMPDAELRHAGAQTALNRDTDAVGKPQKLSRKNTIKQKKARKAAASRADSDEDIAHNSGARFQADLADPRFSGLFQSQDFAIDPTDPRFKQMGGGASAVATAVAKQRSRAIALDPTTADAAPSAPVPAGKKEGLQLSATVEALKRKLGASSGGAAGVPRPAQSQATVSGKKQRKQVAGRLKK